VIVPITAMKACTSPITQLDVDRLKFGPPEHAGRHHRGAWIRRDRAGAPMGVGATRP